MATLHARADGNWTTAATWGVCNATALLDSQAANTALTTAFVSSAAFMPGAITVDGIAVKIASRATSPTGTMSVRLAVGGVAVAGTTVTINVSDIPDDVGTAGSSYTGCSIGWFFFRFASPVTLLAATNYTVQARTSSSSQVNLFRNATAGNWSRLLRTTTTAAPAAGDSLFIGGEWTAAATKTDRTVTIDETATTDYGSASTSLASLGVSKGGTLALATSASTNYRLRLSGILAFWLESAATFGTSGTPLPSTSTFELQFDCAADADFGIVAYISLGFYGADRCGTGITRTRLAADAAATDTSLTVEDSTGWKNGDTIAISPTRRVTNQGEERPLNADASGTSLSFATGLVVDHDGNAAWGAQADVINVTRNLRVVPTSTFVWFFYQRGTTTDITGSWAEFDRMGSTARVGFDIQSGTYSFTDCAFTRSKDDVFVPSASSTATFTFTRCMFWSCQSTTAGAILSASGTGTFTITFVDCVVIGNGTSGSFTVYCNASDTVTMQGSRFSGHECALRSDAGSDLLLVEDCEFSCLSGGVSSGVLINSGNAAVRFRRCKFWRNGAAGAVTVTNSFDVDFEDCEFYGNGSPNLQWQTSKGRLLGCAFASETGYATGTGINVNPGTLDGALDLELHGCSFSEVVGNRIAHGTTDLNISSLLTRFRLLLSGTILRAATPISPSSGYYRGTYIAYQRKDDVADTHQWRLYGYGQIDIETGTFGDASPSMKLTPESAVRKLETNLFTKAVPSGQTATFSAKVRKNGAYNGNAPRLVLKANGAIGVDKDVVLATHTAAADVWETLTGAMPSGAEEDGIAGVVVDCDGTAGNVFVDDVSVTVA